MLLGDSNCEKWGGGQKKKFFINNAVEVLILLKQGYQFLFRLCVPLGESSNVDQSEAASKTKKLKLKNIVPVGFLEFIKIAFAFLEGCWRVLLQKKWGDN